MIVLETERLTLRHASLDDADFMLGLLNEPSFLEFIGDRGVRTVDDARRYIDERFVASYERNGFGLWIVERKDERGAIGICGLVKRETLDEPDLGFAFLPRFWSLGYAKESATAVRDFAFGPLALPRLLAITSDHNAQSIRLLERLGFSLSGVTPAVSGDAPARLYSAVPNAG